MGEEGLRKEKKKEHIHRNPLKWNRNKTTAEVEYALSRLYRKLHGLQDVIPKKVESDAESITYGEMKRKPPLYPCCRTETQTIHNYRTQRVKDTPAFGKRVTLILRKRRYRYPHCGKRFSEKNMFLPRYHRRTNRLSGFVLNRLRSTISFADAAKEVGLSVSTVFRTFDTVSYLRAQLVSTLSIDAFKGNTWGEKCQCILTDPVHPVALDILPKRYGHTFQKASKYIQATA